MDIRGCVYTDAGGRSDVNQDAVLLKVASSRRYGRVAFAMLCDGMGGLDKGEIASAMVIRRFERWFHEELPGIMEDSEWSARRHEGKSKMRVLTEMLSTAAHRRAFAGDVFAEASDRIRTRWVDIINEMNTRMQGYGRLYGLKLGTTLVAGIVFGNEYLIMHVGDSRAYLADTMRLLQLTTDHTYGQYLADEGLIAEDEATCVEDAHLLTQCIGASEVVEPDFTEGTFDGDAVLILCSDGFWRRQDMVRLQKKCIVKKRASERSMENLCRRFVRSVRKLGEEDDASVIMLSCQG